MLYHLVLFKFRSNITAEEAARFYAGVESLTQVDGVVSTQCGEISKNVYAGYSDRTKGYTHSLMVVVKDAESLQNYDNSTLHATVRTTCILPLVDRAAVDPVMAVDYFGKLAEEVAEAPSCVGNPVVWGTAVGVVAALVFGLTRIRSRL